jgi:hypothetical protein
MKPTRLAIEEKTSICWWIALSVLGCCVSLAQEAAGIPYRVLSHDEMDSERIAAERLLKQIDAAGLSGSRLDDLYSKSGLALRTRYTEPAFAARLEGIREPLGVVRQRKFGGFYGPYHTLPNTIDGDYIIIVFKTQFEKRQGTYTEHVTLEADRSGAPIQRLVQYYVSPM